MDPATQWVLSQTLPSLRGQQKGRGAISSPPALTWVPRGQVLGGRPCQSPCFTHAADRCGPSPADRGRGRRSDLACPSHSQSCCRSGSPRARARTLMASWPWRPGLQKSCPVSSVLSSLQYQPGPLLAALQEPWGQAGEGARPAGAEQAGGVRSPARRLPPGALGCSCSSRRQAVHPPY